MIAEMSKVQVAVPTSHKDTFLSWLQEEEALHIVPLKLKEQTGSHTDTAYRLSQVKFSLEFSERIKTELNIREKRNWRRLFAGKPIASLAELQAAMANHQLDEQLTDVRRASDHLNEQTARQHELEEKIVQYTPWRSLSLNGADLASESAVHRLVAVVLANEKKLLTGLSQVPSAAWQEVQRVISKKNGTVYLEAIAHQANTKQLDAALMAHSAAIVTLDLDEDQTPAEKITALQAELTASKKSYQQELVKAKHVLKLEHDLRLIYDYLLHVQEQEALETNSARLSFVYLVAGWLPTVGRNAFTQRLESIIPAAAVEVVVPEKDEQPPILFQNAKFLQPFEAVTDIYGKPKYAELDPSPLLAIFFLVSFGLALTDAGYGLVMMAGTFAADRFFRLKKGMRKMMRLLFYAGLFTTIIGSLTGGWFGVSLEELPPSAVRHALLSIKIIDPISSPISLLVVAFVIGIVQLLFAWGVKGYDLWRNGEKIAALLDSAAWISLVLLIFSWAAGQQGALSPLMAQFVTILLLANIALMIISQGRHHRNILLRLGSGVLSLYGLVNFLSDVLSYSRLLALGLATGIIGLVINLIGGMVTEMVPVVGAVLATVVLLGGHTFNLGINALGAFIHSGRLQFVEFFPKFMEGGGSAYKPFGRVGKYVDNPRDFI